MLAAVYASSKDSAWAAVPERPVRVSTDALVAVRWGVPRSSAVLSGLLPTFFGQWSCSKNGRFPPAQGTTYSEGTVRLPGAGMATANLSGFLRRLTRRMAAETLIDEPDQQLVEQFLAKRDEAAFEALIRRHGPMVYSVCWWVLQQDQDAEDAFQATFLVLAQKLRTVRKHASLASWLHGVARRIALKAKAQVAKRRRR